MSFRLLYVVPFFPFPPHGGSHLRVSNIIARLSRRHKIHLLSLGLGRQDMLAASREMALEFCETVQIIPHSRSRTKSVLGALVTGRPYEICNCYNREMHRQVQEAVNELDPDIVMFSRFGASQYSSQIRSPLKVLDQHDLARYLWQTIIQGSEQWWFKLFARLNLSLVKRYEKKIYSTFDVCISVTGTEHVLTKAFAPPDIQLLIAPNGVDTDYFSPSDDIEAEENSVVLTGTMSGMRNVDAATFFCNKILPLVRRKVPSVKFYIVGRDPSPTVMALRAQDNVIVTGRVPDVRPYLASAAVVVAPYRFGSGMKHKIPIAMSMAKPIVATRNACQGLEIDNRKHVLIADQPSDFAMAVTQLLTNPSLRREMGKNAHSLAIEKYSWNNIVDGLENELINALMSRYQRSPSHKLGKVG